MDEIEKHARCIVPPNDEKIRQQLILKLEEYRQRLAGKGKPWEYQHPELAHLLYEDYRDVCYKIYILEAVLQSKEPVNSWKLSRELFNQWKDAFNISDFCIACGVIDKYCGNLPNEPLLGGTGLPELPENQT